MNKNWSLIESYPDRKIETVFKVEPPLMPVEKGHGYLGVLLRDVTNDLLQCHICGRWEKALSNHLRSHKTTADLYRETYQLPIHCPLVSNSILAKLSERANRPENLLLLAKNRNPKRAHTFIKRKGHKYWKRVYNLSYENKHATCPEQIMRRFMIVSDTIGREPGLRDLMEHDHSLWGAIRRRYKTINNFRKKNNFTVLKRAPLFESDYLLSYIRKFVHENKRIPTASSMRVHTPNIQTFRNHFGSWHKALILAGVISKQVSEKEFIHISKARKYLKPEMA